MPSSHLNWSAAQSWIVFCHSWIALPSIFVIQWCVDSLSVWSPIRYAIYLYNYAMLTYSSSPMGIGEVGIWEQDCSVFFVYIDSRLGCVRDKFYCHIGWSSIACELFHKFTFRAERRGRGGRSLYYGVQGSLQFDLYASHASFTYAGPSINDGRSAKSDLDATFLRTPWIFVHHSATEFRRSSWTSLLSTLVSFDSLGIQRKHTFL